MSRFEILQQPVVALKRGSPQSFSFIISAFSQMLGLNIDSPLLLCCTSHMYTAQSKLSFSAVFIVFLEVAPLKDSSLPLLRHYRKSVSYTHLDVYKRQSFDFD